MAAVVYLITESMDMGPIGVVRRVTNSEEL